MKSFALCATLSAVSLTGCVTPQDLYRSAQQGERIKCNSLPDQADYKRCMQQNSLDYSRYEKERKMKAGS